MVSTGNHILILITYKIIIKKKLQKFQGWLLKSVTDLNNSFYALKPAQICCSRKKHSLWLQMLLLVYLPQLVKKSVRGLILHRPATITWNITNGTNKLSRISFIQKLYLFWDCNSDFLCSVIQTLSRSNLPSLKNRHGIFLAWS